MVLVSCSYLSPLSYFTPNFSCGVNVAKCCKDKSGAVRENIFVYMNTNTTVSVQKSLNATKILIWF